MTAAREALDQLRVALIERGVLAADAPALPELPRQRPWYVSLLLGAAGWLAGILGVVFIALLIEPRGAGSYALIGIVLLVGAVVLYLVAEDAPFLDQLALAVSIAGQVCLTVAVAEASESPALICGFVALMQVALVFLMPNALARTIAAAFACIAWVLAVRLALWGNSLGALLDYGSVSALADERLGLPAMLGTWALIWAGPLALIAWLIAAETRWMAGSQRELCRALLTGTLLGVLSGVPLAEPLSAVMHDVARAPAFASWELVWPLLALGITALCAYWSYRIRARALVGAALITALHHVAHFYYLLGSTLLQKSLAMLLLGGIMLAAGIWLDRRNARVPA
jgi:hypothetical protein